MKISVKVFGLFLLLSVFSPVVFSQTNKESALIKGRQAVKYIDEKKFEEAILLLEEAKRLDPDNYNYPYELGYIYYLKENYTKAKELYTSLLNYPSINDQCYQMLGNVYDMLGDSINAMKTYDEGLKKFPSSGLLYLEKGNMFWNKKQYFEAIPFYEKGIEVNPRLASNYYRLSRIYCASTERIWGIIYGEIFMNLEKNSRRTAEISELLYSTYNDAIKIGGDNKSSVSFSKMMTVSTNNSNKIPFQLAFEIDMTMATIPYSLSSKKELDINALSSIRQSFNDRWFTEKRNAEYPNILFDYHQELIKLNIFEAYNHWILMKGNPKEFDSWQEKHPEDWEKFKTWFLKNSLKVDDTHHFYTGQYF